MRDVAAAGLALTILCAAGAAAQEARRWGIVNAGIGDFAIWATEPGVAPAVADFNSDGRDDVALLRQTPGWGSVPVAFAAGGGGWSIANGGVGDFAVWAADPVVQPLIGDFDGDGRHDLALLRRGPGWSTMPVALAAGSGAWSIRNGQVGDFAAWATEGGVRPLAGDFNGDGRHDVALLRQEPGWSTLPVAFAAGDGNWSIANGGIPDFAAWAVESGVQPLAGDFDGDGRTDVALLRQTPGWTTLPVAFADGTGGWSITNAGIGDFAAWATEPGVSVLVGDFDGDRRSDVGLLRRSPGWGSMPVAFAAGGGNWTVTNGAVGDFAVWATEDGVQPILGDFDGDGRDDVALLRQTAGWSTMPTALAAGSGQWTITNDDIGPFAVWATEPAVAALVGNFDDSPGDDVALLRQTPGWSTMPAALSLFPAAAASIESELDRPGEDYRSFDLPRPEPALCQRACAEDGRCQAYTYVRPGVQGAAARCWLKAGVPAAGPNLCCTSGTRLR
jgi:hypothetical protein